MSQKIRGVLSLGLNFHAFKISYLPVYKKTSPRCRFFINAKDVWSESLEEGVVGLADKGLSFASSDYTYLYTVVSEFWSSGKDLWGKWTGPKKIDGTWKRN